MRVRITSDRASMWPQDELPVGYEAVVVGRIKGVKGYVVLDRLLNQSIVRDEHCEVVEE